MAEKDPREGTGESSPAVRYLASFLNKTLRIQISDRRLFVGQMKCTDKDQNIILQHAQEYRETSKSSNDSASSAGAQGTMVGTANLTSRYVGLIVVPGEHITKIEVEEFDPSLIV